MSSLPKAVLSTEHYNTAHHTSTAEISTPSIACSTHSNQKHLRPRLLRFSACLYDQVVNVRLTDESTMSRRGEVVPPSLKGDRGFPDFLVGAAEIFLAERFLTSAVRTSNPEEADFFYVPTW
eukprot:514739-Prorocentrum_minimum.AAC.1